MLIAFLFTRRYESYIWHWIRLVNGYSSSNHDGLSSSSSSWPSDVSLFLSLFNRRGLESQEEDDGRGNNPWTASYLWVIFCFISCFCCLLFCFYEREASDDEERLTTDFSSLSLSFSSLIHFIKKINPWWIKELREREKSMESWMLLLRFVSW